MSRYPKMTPARAEKLIDQGYGQGKGLEYKPWFAANQIPSKGRLVRSMGVTTGRVMHLVSELEGSIQLLADFDPTITDQNEQFLLDPSLTLAIARKLGIRHPRERYTGNLLPMTTDLLLTQELNGLKREIAVSVKYEAELNGPKALRVRQKLKVEEMFHAIKGRPFYLATDGHVSPRQMANLRWLRESHREGASVLTNEQRDAFSAAFLGQRTTAKTIGERVDRASRSTGLLPQHGLDAFRLSVWARAIKVDIRQWLRLSSPFIPCTEANLGVQMPWTA